MLCCRGASALCSFGRGADAPPPGAALARRVVLDDELDVTDDRHLGALGATHETGLELVELDLEVAGNGGPDLGVTAERRHLEGLGALALGLDVDELARLHAEGRAVDELAVDEDVAVHDELTRLRRGAGEARTEHEGVETHLEQLDEVLTRQAVLAAGLVERVAHLLLADAVLLAQTLLLAEADGVVTVLLALGAAVLTRSVRTLLEVLGGLGRQRDAERAGESDLAAVLGLRGHEGVLPNYVAASFAAHGRIDFPADRRARRGMPMVVWGKRMPENCVSSRSSLSDRGQAPDCGRAAASSASA